MRLNLRNNRQPWHTKHSYENVQFSTLQRPSAVAPEVYNGVRSKPSRSLGLETPDCSKVVIGGHKTRLLGRPPRSGRRTSEAITSRPQYSRSMSCPSSAAYPTVEELERRPLDLAARVTSLYDEAQYKNFKEKLYQNPHLIEKVDYFTRYYRSLLRNEIADETLLVRELIMVTMYNKLCLDRHLRISERNDRTPPRGLSEVVPQLTLSDSTEDEWTDGRSTDSDSYESENDSWYDDDSVMPKGGRKPPESKSDRGLPDRGAPPPSLGGAKPFYCSLEPARSSVLARYPCCEVELSDDSDGSLETELCYCQSELDNESWNFDEYCDYAMPCKSSNIPVYQRPKVSTPNKNVSRVHINPSCGLQKTKKSNELETKNIKRTEKPQQTKIPTTVPTKAEPIKLTATSSISNGNPKTKLASRVQPKKPIIQTTTKSNKTYSSNSNLHSKPSSNTSSRLASNTSRSVSASRRPQITAQSSVKTTTKSHNAGRSISSVRSHTSQQTKRSAKLDQNTTPTKLTSEPRARIVKRVMSSPKQPMKESDNRVKPKNSKEDQLGSRNNTYRSSGESQRTESTGDSGCSSPSNDSHLSSSNNSETENGIKDSIKKQDHPKVRTPIVTRSIASPKFNSLIKKSNSLLRNNGDSKMPIKTFAKAKSFMKRYNEIPVTTTPVKCEPELKVRKPSISVSINVKPPAPPVILESSDDSDSNNEFGPETNEELIVDGSMSCMNESMLFIDADESVSSQCEGSQNEACLGQFPEKCIPLEPHEEMSKPITTNQRDFDDTTEEETILSHQFDAIIHTLKKVAASMEDHDKTLQQKDIRKYEQTCRQDELLQIGDPDGSLLPDILSNGSYKYGARSTISLNQELQNENCPTQRSFRKVSSSLNLRKNSSEHSDKSPLKKSLSKSKELLSQLEHEYSLLRGDRISSNPLEEDTPASSVEKRDQRTGLQILEKFRISKPGAKPKSADGRHIFSFFQKKSRKSSAKSFPTNECDQVGVVGQREAAPPAEPCDTDEESSFSQRSLSLPKRFLSDQYGCTHISSDNRASFPWVQADDTRPRPLTEQQPLQNTRASHTRYRKQSDQTGIRKSSHGATISRTLRREKTNSSPPLYRSSLSQSECDIYRQWSLEASDRASLSQSVCQLEEPPYDQVPLGDPLQESSTTQGVSCPTENSSNSSGVLQKFKKSLSLRLAKKNSRSDAEDLCPGSVGVSVPERAPPPASLPRRSACDPKEEKHNFLFGHPIFRSSKERRKAKLKDGRASKCNSADSGDSGIELVSGASTLASHGTPAHTSVFENSNFTDVSPHATTDRAHCHQDDKADERNGQIRRTCSDIGGSVISQGRSLPSDPHRQYSRQYSSPQPVKSRPLHRLPNYPISTIRNKMKRSKASAELRRSVSQPMDLNKSFEAQLCLRPNGALEDDSTSKRTRRPSVGNLLSDENTSEEDIHASDNEETPEQALTSLEQELEFILYAEALWDHVSLDADELVFKAGDLITVIDRSDKDWWWGRISSRLGWFPAAFVRLLVNQEEHHEKVRPTKSGDTWQSSPGGAGGLSSEQIRTNVVNEILSTEQDFVKHLQDVIEGYLKQIRKRPDMFSEETVTAIFGNLEALYAFQSDFLKQLEACVDQEAPHRSCIGECFIRNRARFEIYSEYCNNHPGAVSALQQIYRDQKLVHFLEACRLLQQMIDISLDGFLLTPVQRICKYPLQLQELLKYTKPTHADYVNVGGAMQAMREVALLVNERKRRMECLEKIASWQATVEGWEGADLLDDSTQLIHQGEVTKGVGGAWPKEVILFLFDHQLIYCKKDIIKRNTFVYRGRINMDLCEVIDIPDTKDSSRNSAMYHAWKILCLGKSKNYIFCCKTATEKEKWLAAFRKERKLVAADEDAGFVVSERQKQSARIAARSSTNRPKKPRSSKSRTQEMTFAQARRLVSSETENKPNSLPRNANPPDAKKKGTWFPFVHKKSRSHHQPSGTR